MTNKKLNSKNGVNSLVFINLPIYKFDYTSNFACSADFSRIIDVAKILKIRRFVANGTGKGRVWSCNEGFTNFRDGSL